MKTFITPKIRSVKLEAETWAELDALFLSLGRRRSTKEHFYEEIILQGIKALKGDNQLSLFDE